MTSRVQSVERAARVLLAFERADRPSPTVGDLAAELGVHKSTASRIVATLVEHELLDVDVDGQRLWLGLAVRRLGAVAAGQPDLAELAQPVIDALAVETGDTATLSIPNGGSVTTLAQSLTHHLVGASTWVGLRTPVHATSDGKVMLAHGAVALSPALLQRCTPATVVNRAVLAAELDVVRERGWASSRGEFEEGLNGVAVPVVDTRGRCRAAICVAGPQYRVRPERFAELAEACRRAARTLVASTGAAAALAARPVSAPPRQRPEEIPAS